jgi:hypothetical protein
MPTQAMTRIHFLITEHFPTAGNEAGILALSAGFSNVAAGFSSAIPLLAGSMNDRSMGCCMDTSGRVVVTTTLLNGPGRPNQSIVDYGMLTLKVQERRHFPVAVARSPARLRLGIGSQPSGRELA